MAILGGQLSYISTTFPITLADRAELDAGLVQISASFEEFCELLEVCEYQIEYHNGEIILMSIASDPHEKIVANLLFLFGLFFRKRNEYNRYGSNRHVFQPSFPNAYSPDASIVKGTPDIMEYAKGKTANHVSRNV